MSLGVPLGYPGYFPDGRPGSGAFLTPVLPAQRLQVQSGVSEGLVAHRCLDAVNLIKVSCLLQSHSLLDTNFPSHCSYKW
ncbi:hypothetical protein XELAEV_18015273mg [Xenopus laevis]|uniref:Uncharacterized protein n=1 Tax=Xenopus laevis TaxID=8355 RepID=A0A974DK98_XENLA|nr:hypothetical protein XELAEV_18015273mg [Xenopus laevis]